LLLPVALAFGLTGMNGVAAAGDFRTPTGVIEMFTSQGCSSCPPADRVLAEVAQNRNVLALGWHVDYWDYLGWKDTFGLPQATKRQRAYAVSFGNKGVYTPQAVINGRVDVVGSRGKDVTEALSRMAGTEQGLPIVIGATVENGVIAIDVEPSAAAKGSMLWMVYYDKSRTVEVAAGENGGHSLTYVNIVRDMEMIGMVGDQPLHASFPMVELGRRGFEECALVLQSKRAGKPGAILGALVIENLPK